MKKNNRPWLGIEVLGEIFCSNHGGIDLFRRSVLFPHDHVGVVRDIAEVLDVAQGTSQHSAGFENLARQIMLSKMLC